MTAPVLVGPSTSSGGPTPIDLDDYLPDIGDRIRAERQARGLTEGALAQRAHLDRATIRRVQDGIGQLRHFIQVCAALDVQLDYLLSERWVMPERRPSLYPSHVRVLRAVADGRPLSVAARELGMTPAGLASLLSQAYRRLGVGDVPRGERRQAAVRAAVRHGLLDAA